MHDRVARWLRDWLDNGRVDSEVLLEQVVTDPPGRLDVVFGHEGRRIWVDVALPSVTSSCARTLRNRAKTDGIAARDEEKHKKAKYRGLATPFVIERQGRPGRSARSFLIRFALEEDGSRSGDVAEAWRSISAIIQRGSAEIELATYGGWNASVELWVP